MCTDVQVETAQSVAAERVGAALEDDGCGSVDVYRGADDVLEEFDVLVVFDARVERDVEGMVGAGVGVGFGACVLEGAGAGEEFFWVVFVEGDCHDAVGGPEGLFDAVAVVDVDVDV